MRDHVDPITLLAEPCWTLRLSDGRPAGSRAGSRHPSVAPATTANAVRWAASGPTAPATRVSSTARTAVPSAPPTCWATRVTVVTSGLP